MKSITRLLAGSLLLAFSCTSTPTSEPAAPPAEDSPEITFYTPDSLQIFGDLFITDKAAPTLLLFHQGGSNARAEYGPIIPRLLDSAYNVLAIDQRPGGQLYGSYNRTLVGLADYGFTASYDYCSAYDNLESALDYVIREGFTGPKILWGSSYSAALAVQLAHERPEDVSAVLSFSPASGGPMEGCIAGPYFESLQVPLLIMTPENEITSENGRAQYELALEHDIQVFVAPNARHGSSMLVEERVEAPVEENWQVVWAFLAEI